MGTFEDAIEAERRRQVAERASMMQREAAARQELTDFANSMSRHRIPAVSYLIVPFDASPGGASSPLGIRPYHLASPSAHVLHGWTISRNRSDGIGHAVGTGGQAIQFCGLMYAITDDGVVRALGRSQNQPRYRGVILDVSQRIQLELRLRRSSLAAVALRLIQGDGPIEYDNSD